MAVGFTPRHEVEIPLYELTQEQFLSLAYQTALYMGLKVGYISENGLIAFTDNGMLRWNAEVKINIDNGFAKIRSASIGNEMVDWGKNKKNVNNFLATLDELKTTSSIESLEENYLSLKENFVSAEEDILNAPPATTTEQLGGFFSIFRPKRGFFVTPILLNITILIFILMVIGGANIMLPDNESLLRWGANFRPTTLDGQWWRLLTNCFLHIGILHLFMNMYALIYIGVLLEPILGKTRFVSAYLLTGIAASVTSLCWHDLTISAGASGAIFGMYGVFLALLTTTLIEKTTRKALLTSIGIFVGYNLLNGLKDGIDNAAHIGGLVSGLVIGYAFIPGLKEPAMNKLKYGAVGLLAILTLGSSFIVCKNIPNDIGVYETQMKTFITRESAALEVFNLAPSTPNEKVLYEINERGIYFWEENIKLIDSFKQLDLPLQIVKRNQLLRQYCELRIKSYETLAKLVAEENTQDREQFDAYNKQIEDLVKELIGPKE